MLQKVAAILGKVAADLCFRVSNMRLLLPEKYFELAATYAANLGFVYLVPLYTIVVLNTQRFGALMSESVSMNGSITGLKSLDLENLALE